MHGNKTFNRFDLHDDGTGHYQVKAITTIELEPFVSDWQRHLRFKRQLSQSEFITEVLGICRFQQPGSKRAVHFNRCTDHGLSDLVYLQFSSASPRLRGYTQFQPTRLT